MSYQPRTVSSVSAPVASPPTAASASSTIARRSAASTGSVWTVENTDHIA